MTSTRHHDVVADARAAAETVTDPELPMLTLADLGVLRDVDVVDGRVIVSITPTYTGCPAMDTMRDDLVRTLHEAGYDDVEVRTVLHPPWSTDWISEEGKRKLAEAGIAPPGAAPSPQQGPVPLTLEPAPSPMIMNTSGPMWSESVHDHGRGGGSAVRCPQCGSPDTEEVSRFSATACKALRRCRSCTEPFEHVKEI
ncbi:phenylacetate-CoA oxygenase subunit PaaJ [Actinobacteria bacterium YIM 96077]|uniref:Phenylacetate-CoA oxygenase subunit PaaJ n=1 Tax=Phytoactinopolyspora halophila TaxID=1981511 RepID=A0A329QTK4_9ACTN|nr:1,2-phenylacetyl-CoA epoxidase subunit PaaD [Phytoactinopolyspora halophila]AYY14913.1 phenylacetate-CoA oxygenase subunit PaaJ [Actinobacteria bacterium YIM 96077]RAW15371.1 phenylacetate-CoA oxygenase subunit PaaJ [Phytoactinopolyspora halophila]